MENLLSKACTRAHSVYENDANKHFDYFKCSSVFISCVERAAGINSLQFKSKCTNRADDAFNIKEKKTANNEEWKQDSQTREIRGTPDADKRIRTPKTPLPKYFHSNLRNYGS